MKLYLRWFLLTILLISQLDIWQVHGATVGKGMTGGRAGKGQSASSFSALPSPKFSLSLASDAIQVRKSQRRRPTASNSAQCHQCSTRRRWTLAPWWSRCLLQQPSRNDDSHSTLHSLHDWLNPLSASLTESAGRPRHRRITLWIRVHPRPQTALQLHGARHPASAYHLDEGRYRTLRPSLFPGMQPER